MKKIVEAEPILSYIEHLKNCGLGKSRSLNYLTKYIECMKSAYDVDRVLEEIDEKIKFYENQLEQIDFPSTIISSDKGLWRTRINVAEHIKEIVKEGKDE